MKPSEVLDALIQFVDDPEEVAQMTPEEIREYLKAAGVDIEAERERLRRRLITIMQESASNGGNCDTCSLTADSIEREFFKG